MPREEALIRATSLGRTPALEPASASGGLTLRSTAGAGAFPMSALLVLMSGALGERRGNGAQHQCESQENTKNSFHTK